MRTKDILDGFSKPEVRDIASRLGFVLPAGTPKPEMVTFVARSLGASCGWSGAIDELLGVLQRQELLDLLDREWLSADGPLFVATSKLSRLRADDLRDLARDVGLAEAEDKTTRLPDVFARTVTSTSKVAAMSAHASWNRSLWSPPRGVRIACAPLTLHRIPLCLRRCVTSVLHAASTTPEPLMKPFDWSSM